MATRLIRDQVVQQPMNRARRNTNAHATSLVCALVLLNWLLTSPPTAAGWRSSQAEIRVQSDQVLVPVLVLDKEGIARLRRLKPDDYFKRATAADSHLFSDIAVSDLSAKDFQVLDDGREQKIESLIPEPQFSLPLRDNTSLYAQSAGVGGGIWSSLDIPEREPKFAITRTGGQSGRNYDDVTIRMPDLPGYLIAYVPPPSADGSCHRVIVNVRRSNLLVYARSEYCSTSRAAADPLFHSDLEKLMQSDLKSPPGGKIGFSLKAFVLFATQNENRIQISLQFPERVLSLKGNECATPPDMALLGIVSATDGSLAARFSDVMSRTLNFRGQALPLLLPAGSVSCILPGPDRYDGQIFLPPGEYKLRVDVRDADTFGWAETPLIVEHRDAKHLAISDIVLAHQSRSIETLVQSPPVRPFAPYAPLISNGEEYSPAADVSFLRTEHLFFYFQLYDPQLHEGPICSPSAFESSAQSHCGSEVIGHMRIVEASTGNPTKEFASSLASSYDPTSSSVIPVSGQIDTRDLPSGDYRLEVQATDSAGQSTPWHSASFSIH
jgi:hypothetical protein